MCQHFIAVYLKANVFQRCPLEPTLPNIARAGAALSGERLRAGLTGEMSQECTVVVVIVGVVVVPILIMVFGIAIWVFGIAMVVLLAMAGTLIAIYNACNCDLCCCTRGESICHSSSDGWDNCGRKSSKRGRL